MSLAKRIFHKATHLIKPQEKKLKSVFENKGHCPTCDSDVTFIAYSSWLRDHYVCANCGSIPRERALMYVIENFCPAWRELTIHESSPATRGASARLSSFCKDYIASQFFPATPLGSTVNGVRCENLEQMTFADESIDLHVTQDVMEHVYHPSKVWKEVARTLKPGGAHIFTVPIVNKTKLSNLRARLDADGQPVHVLPPVYHGNPISDKGSLVTVDWGFDICKHIFDSSGLFTYVFYMDDLNKGIRAEYIEVLITQKPGSAIPDPAIP